MDDPATKLPYPAELRCLTGLCLFAGMRLVDAVSLRWANVDDAAGCIRYTPIQTARTSGVEAVVPILAPLRRFLDALPRETERVLPQAGDHYGRNPDFIKVHLVEAIHAVTGNEGKQGVQSQRLRDRSLYGVHSLRKTFATEAARAGAQPAYLSMMTGDTLQTLQRYYVKVGYQQDPVSGFEELPRLIGGNRSGEPEREELRRLAEELPLERVRELVRLAQAESITPQVTA
jgi:integrase